MLKFILITLLLSIEVTIAGLIKTQWGEQGFYAFAIFIWIINWPLAVLILDR